MTTQNRTREQTPRLGWPVPAALVALTAIPLIVGTLRLLQLAGGAELIPAEERFAGFPLPVALHILGAATYVLLGALQFVPQFRRRHRTWHRRAGRILIVAGLLVAASALWMTLLYAAKPGTGRPAVRPSARVRVRRWSPAWSSASPPSVAGTFPPTGPG